MSDIFGIYLVNKPVGITSHDVVSRLRRITGERRIGHAGTLDPFAEGLLVVAIGRQYTKQISDYVGLSKEYVAEAVLGKNSDTHDKEGVIKDVSDKVPGQREVEEVLSQFLGEQMQMPPAYSAKKIGGKKAYELARLGQRVVLEPREIKIYEIKFLELNYPVLRFQTQVSSGTYIRSLAYDIGNKLQTGAHLQSLIRTRVGDYSRADAINLDDIKTSEDLRQFKIK